MPTLFLEKIYHGDTETRSSGATTNLAADFRRCAQIGGIENRAIRRSGDRVIRKSKEEATRIRATKEEIRD
jgi:hypothetical protein